MSSSIKGLLTKGSIAVTVTPGYGTDRTKDISYSDLKMIGNGSFGVVYQAKLDETNEPVAIKKVLQDKRFKNRELQIMRKLEHPNVVKLMYFFYNVSESKEDYLNLILEFMPRTVHQVARNYAKQRQPFPAHYIKLYMFQLFRALNYIHSMGVCHRDIKPQNLLVNPDLGILKLCDFGSAKILVKGEQNVSYICSRYYRAPELIFGATDYTTSIDVWSAGTVVAELFLSQPIFPGESGVDQLVEIIKILGTPTREQIRQMNPHYQEFTFPQIKAHPWSKVFRSRTPSEGVDLLSQLLVYNPVSRLTSAEACAHPFFDDLRGIGDQIQNSSIPDLFQWSPEELSTIAEDTRAKILPSQS